MEILLKFRNALIPFFLILSTGIFYAQQSDSIIALTVKTEKNSELLLQDAIAHYDGKRFNRCLEVLIEALNVNHNGELSDILYYYKALTYIKLNDNLKAISQLDTAIAYNNNKEHYYFLRAEMQIQSGNFKLADLDLDKTLGLNPAHEGALNNKGMIFQESGIIDEAIEYYNKTLAINPKNGETYYLRGLIYLQNGMPDKGCDDLQKGEDIGHALAKTARIKYCL